MRQGLSRSADFLTLSARAQIRFLPETTGPGCAFLDYDNDGWMDIYLVNSGKCDFYDPNPVLRNALYHNNGDGTFTDVTEKAGVAAPGWSSSAVWFDYDNDGKLDLFVCQFVEFSKALNKSCGPGEEGKHGYCIPRLYKPMANWLFHNNGDGTFTDVSKTSGIASSLGKAWGVVATDLNNDGLLDLFVSNDTAPNFVFMNRGKGRFEENGTSGGVAYSDDGRARSGMGLDSADFNQDGWIDLFLANGNPDDLIESLHSQVKYQEPLMLFHNSGKSFQNVSSQSGPVFAKPLSARGMAIGDFNNDGGIDVLVAINDGAPVLLRNTAGSQNHWLGINLVGTKSNPDAIGARVTYQSGDLKQQRMKIGGGSFLSSHDPRMVLGIGKRTKLDWLEIHWPQPSGKVERITELPIDRYITIVEGTGKWK